MGTALLGTALAARARVSAGTAAAIVASPSDSVQGSKTVYEHPTNDSLVVPNKNLLFLSNYFVGLARRMQS